MKKTVVMMVFLVFLLAACNGNDTTGRVGRDGGNLDLIAIQFDTQGGNTLERVFVARGETLNLDRTPVKEGYTFVRWYLDEALTTPYQEAPLDEDLIVYARWQLNQYMLRYFDKDGDEINALNIPFDQVLSLDEGPLVEGYHFVAWEEDSQPFVLTRMPARDVHLTASYALNWITFTFNVLGETTEVTGFFGESVSYPEDPDIDGLVFKGWTRTPNVLEDFRVDDFPNFSWALYAYFEVIEYTLSFDENFADLLFTVLDPPEVPSIEPQRLGYTFTGWYTDETYTTLFDFENPPANDTQVYAGFEINTYTIQFINPRGEDPESFMVEYLGTIPSLPVVDDPAFLGWFIAEAMAPYDDQTMPAENLVLTARFNDE